MPYFLLDGQSVYDKLHAAKSHLLVFSAEKNNHESLKEDLENEYSELVDFHEIALDAKLAETFGTDQSFCLLLRPDNYIGYLSTEISLNPLKIYLQNFLGAGSKEYDPRTYTK